MNHRGTQHGHMWLIGALAIVALLLGYGIGFALALAMIACAVMLGAIVWYLQRAEQPPQPQQNHQDELQPR